MRHFIVAAMFVAGLSVSGCVYVPPVWDIGDAIYEVDQIEEGTTTREEVLDLLGEPDTEQEEQRLFIYRGERSDGYLVMLPQNWMLIDDRLIDKEHWWIWIKFDENDLDPLRDHPRFQAWMRKLDKQNG